MFCTFDTIDSFSSFHHFYLLQLGHDNNEFCSLIWRQEIKTKLVELIETHKKEKEKRKDFKATLRYINNFDKN